MDLNQHYSGFNVIGEYFFHTTPQRNNTAINSDRISRGFSINVKIFESKCFVLYK